MANNAPHGVSATTRRHGAHDSRISLDVASNKDDVVRMRLRELEEENSLLAERTTAASQRFADYENHILQLRTQLREQQERHNAALATQHNADPERPITPHERPPGLSRLGSFMRKPSLVPTTTGPSAREQELEASLAKAESARIDAENKTKQVNAEIEDLSATLFQQANDMVAAERKENAALKERIRELERAGGDEIAKQENEKLRQKLQVMEQRDLDRRKRLERLEAAQRRIDRVRTMLMPR